ncbi:GSCOCG00011438001-RA-CDS [Cotesia congregata]|nr:GSCOCG00011438001-RA-CDS [Cotesia congregata]
MSTQVYEIVEKRAITIAECLRAEYWSVSSKTNDGITELFSRIAALSFNAAIIRELNSTKQEQKIGTNLITLKRHEPEIEKKSKFIKWPSCFN